VAESARITSGHEAARSPNRRPWLRLVRAEPDDVGPVSPELVLVDPPLAAAVRMTPDAVVVDEGARPSEPLALPRQAVAERRRTAAAHYDTHDRLLERHGLKLELTGGRSPSWRLTAARGEQVILRDEGAGVPVQIERLLRTVIREHELVEVPARSADPDIRRIEDLVAKQHRSLLRHDVGARIATDPESLHQIRVAARRVRAFLAVARNHVDADWAAEITEGMRRVGKASNDARDVDILLDKVRAEVRRFDVRDRPAAEALIGRLEDDRRKLQRTLVAALDSDRYHHVLDQLASPAVPAPERPARKLDQLAARELRRLVSRVRRLGKRPPDEALHALRIKVKRVRYAAELGGSPSHKSTRRVIDSATRIQDLLGAHQDAVVAVERLRALAHALDETGISFAAGQLAVRERVRRDEIHEHVPSAWKELRRLAQKLDRT
jgi:CHAD domain-containing protein